MSMESESARPTSPRGVRLLLASSGLAFMGLLGLWSATQVIGAFHQGRTLRAAALAVVSVLLLLLSVRIIALNWRAVSPSERGLGETPDGVDQTGNWGVGGPSMREPGSTGMWPTRKVDRRYEGMDE